MADDAGIAVRRRVVGWRGPIAAARLAHDPSGLDYPTALAGRRLPGPPVGELVGITDFEAGVGALHRALDSLDRLAALRARRAFPGHGRAIDDSPAALDAARRRYESWLGRPETLAWHACKRIFAYALMIRGGLPEAEVAPYLLACPWFGDYSRHCFAAAPEDMVRPLLAEMVRSGAAGWRAGRLVALAPHTPPAPGWPRGPAQPDAWPATDAVTDGRDERGGIDAADRPRRATHEGPGRAQRHGHGLR